MALAFHREEKLTPDGRRLARKGSGAYPGRSAIADIIPQSSIRQTLVGFWEFYLTINLCEVAICKEVGITPAGFYNLQTKETYYGYQTDLSQRLQRFFQKYKGQGKEAQNKMTRLKVMQLLLTHAERSRVVSLSMWQNVLNKNGDNGSQNLHQSYMQGVPNALVCLDEARELIKDDGCLLFRSFREAFRKRFLRSSNPADPTKPQRDFFAVLLDTTFKVWDSPPPAHWDHNQKGLNEWDVKQRPFPQYTVSTQMIFITKARTLRSKMVLQRQLCSFFV